MLHINFAFEEFSEFQQGGLLKFSQKQKQRKGYFHGDENEGEVNGFTWSTPFNEL